MDKNQIPSDIQFNENGDSESILLQLFASVMPTNRPENFQRMREEFEKAVAEEVMSETKE